MPEPDFDRLGHRLLDDGIAPRHAWRTILELREHYADLREELVAEGLTTADAEREASQQLGPLDDIARLIGARPELRCWSYRYPRIGRVVLPIAWAAALPVTPLIAGIGYVPAIVPTIARWGAIVSLSAVITAGMFLAIQLSITLG